MKPLLAHCFSPERITYPCWLQPKLNGVRALYQNGSFQSRDEIPWKPEVLAHLAKPLQEAFRPDAILDGELYVHGWSLQRINSAVTPVRNAPTKDTLLVEYWVFDVVDYQASFIDRFENFSEAKRPAGVHAVTTISSKDALRADKFYGQTVQDGFEGIMYRLGDCPYTIPKQRLSIRDARMSPLTCATIKLPSFWSDKNNRCWHLLKRKSWQDAEFLCTGILEGEGRLSGMVGALVCDNLFTVGSGLSDPQRIDLWQNPPIGRTLKVKYLVLSENGIPLNPTLLAIL